MRTRTPLIGGLVRALQQGGAVKRLPFSPVIEASIHPKNLGWNDVAG